LKEYIDLNTSGATRLYESTGSFEVFSFL